MDAPQGSAEWHWQRLGKVTASRVKDIMSTSARGTPLKAYDDYKRELVIERLTGMPARLDPFVTKEMLWGQMNEAAAATAYQLETGRKVQTCGLIDHPTIKWFAASPDRLVGEDGMIEIKCLTSMNHAYEVIKNGDPPEEHIHQMQTQLCVTGREWVDFVAFDSRLPKGLQLFVKRVEKDDDYQNMLIEEVEIFLMKVDRDIRFFESFMELADRTCYDCGVMNRTYVEYCTSCGSRNIYVETVVRPAPRLADYNKILEEYLTK